MNTATDKGVRKMTNQQSTKMEILSRIDENERAKAQTKEKGMIEYLEARLKELRERLDNLN